MKQFIVNFLAISVQLYFGHLEGISLAIVEIGTGYGGQCKILSALGGFASYTIVDLPEVNTLTKKFLHRQGIYNVDYINCNDPLPMENNVI